MGEFRIDLNIRYKKDSIEIPIESLLVCIGVILIQQLILLNGFL